MFTVHSKFVFNKWTNTNTNTNTNLSWGEKMFQKIEFYDPDNFLEISISIYVHLVVGEECKTVINKRL